MVYVGIKNWPEKAALLRSGDYEHAHVETDALTFDCERHLSFLHDVIQFGVDLDPRRTLYHAFYRFLKSEKSAMERSERFRLLFEKMKNGGLNEDEFVISVTTDGARLDGSHRGSIARVLGLSKVHVKIFRWPDEKKVVHIQQEIRTKQQMHLQDVGRPAYSVDNREYLGRVVYTDILPVEKRFLSRKSYEFRPLLALEKEGSFLYTERSNVTLLEE